MKKPVVLLHTFKQKKEAFVDNMTMQEIIEDRQTLEVIDGLLEMWFLENEVPMEYQMSIPFIVLFEKIEKDDFVEVSFYLGALYNHGGGNC